MIGMKIGSASSGEVTITSRMFQSIERFAILSFPSAARPAHAS